MGLVMVTVFVMGASLLTRASVRPPTTTVQPVRVRSTSIVRSTSLRLLRLRRNCTFWVERLTTATTTHTPMTKTVTMTRPMTTHTLPTKHTHMTMPMTTPRATLITIKPTSMLTTATTTTRMTMMMAAPIATLTPTPTPTSTATSSLWTMTTSTLTCTSMSTTTITMDMTTRPQPTTSQRARCRGCLPWTSP